MSVKESEIKKVALNFFSEQVHSDKLRKSSNSVDDKEVVSVYDRGSFGL